MDMEAALVPVMQAAFTARVLTSTPDDLQDILPVIKVLASGGTGDAQRMDSMGVEVDVFAAGDVDASALAWSVYHWFMEGMPAALGNVGVRRTDDASLPIATAYANVSVFRYTFNVLIHTHDRRF